MKSSMIVHQGLAGVEGIEPPVAVLETAGLPLTDTPRFTFECTSNYILPRLVLQFYFSMLHSAICCIS